MKEGKFRLLFVLSIIMLLLANCASPTLEAQQPQATQPPAENTSAPDPTDPPTTAPSTEETEPPAVEPTTAPEAGEPESGGTLIAARTIEIHGLDPHKNPAYDNLRFYEMVYNGLVVLNENLEVVPELAESWEESEDGLVLTFHLRQGVKFHDGQEMTSEDVKASFEHILDPETGSPASAFFVDMESIEAPDPYTVVFNLKSPNAAIVTLMASPNAMIVPKSAIDGGKLDTEVVGTGAFRVDEWVPDNYLRLVRFDDFFIEGLPYLDAIEYRVLPDEASILAGLRTDTINWAIIQEVRNAVLARREGNLQVQGGPGLNTMVLAFNAEREPLNNPLVRKAVACAVDRQQIADVTFLGEAVPTGPLPPSIGEQYRVPLSELDCYERDVEQARSLLAEAGYPDGVSFSLLTRNFSPYPELAEIVQSQLKEVGIETEIQVEEFGIFVDRWRAHDFDAYISVTAHYPDPDFGLYRTFHTDGSANVHAYSNPDLDTLLEQGRASLDPAERGRIYQDVQKLIAEDAPFVFLVAENQYRVMQPYLMGFEHIPTGSIVYLREAWLDQ